MKKYIFTLAAMAALMISCTKENNPGQNGKLTFSVTKEAIGGTKAELSGTNVNFAAGDKISVFAGATNHEFTTTAGGATATFTSGDSVEEFENYLVLSPYNENATRISATSMRVNVTIPEVQVATPNGVDPSALISAGLATGTGTVQLKNVVGLIQIVVPAGITVKELYIGGGSDAGIGICGDYIFNVDNGALEYVTMKNVIKVIPQSGETTIPAGTYYVAVRPKPDYNNVVVSYVNASNQLCKRTTSGFVYVNRNHIVPFGSLDDVNYAPVLGRATLRYADATPQFTGTLKQLAGGAGGFTDKDTKIKKIIFKAHTLYKKDGTSVISNGPNSDVQIHAWIEGDTVYVCTEAAVITLYSASNNLFRDFAALEEVTFNDVNAMSNTTFDYMFRNCNNLKKVDFGNADFSNVLHYTNMFFNLPALEYVSFGETSVNAAANTTLMMYKVINLKTLKLGPNFSLPATFTRMFDATAMQTSLDAGEDVSKKCQLYCSQAFYDSVKDDYDDATAAYSNTYFNKHRFVLNVL